MKTCSKCKINKDESEFAREKRSKDGFRGSCKGCAKDIENKIGLDGLTRQQRRAKPGADGLTQNQRQHAKLGVDGLTHNQRAKARIGEDGMNAAQRGWYRRTYGITPDEINHLKIEQGGACAICGQKDKKLCIDHCHRTGKIRGLLCAPCNKGIGFLEDSAERLASATKYLIKYTTT